MTNPAIHPQRRSIPQIREKTSIIELPEENRAQGDTDFRILFLSRKILRSNPISSFPIFIPNTTLRRSDSVPWNALSSWMIRLSARISEKALFEKNISGLVPLEVRRSFGKDGFFFSVFHRSRDEPERTFIFFSSRERVTSPLDPRTSRAQSV